MPRDKKRSRKPLKIILLGFACAIPVFVLYLYSLNFIIEKKFGGDRRWNIPSRVYSDAEYLYPGIDLQERRLIQKLERLHYRNMQSPLTGPGDFFQMDDRLEIYLHDFSYPGEAFKGFPIRIKLEQKKIKNITDIESGENLALVRLEPEEMATLFDEKMEDRTLITLQKTPAYLLEAIILLEDERFFKHHGVDPVAIARAAVADLVAMKIVQGGSTLTQQLVKNFFLTADRSLLRKVNEAFMALVIEQKYSKDEILEAYLNEIYLGQRGPSSVTGVAEASKHYFGKEVHQMTLGEAAMLAGLIRNPNSYSPVVNPKRAKERRDFVLKRMLEADLITPKQYTESVAEKLITPKIKIKPIQAPFFVDFVKWQLADLYPPEVLETEGLRIFTTLDMTLQFMAEQAVAKGIPKLEEQWQSILPKEKPNELQACLIATQPQNGYVRAMVGGRDYSTSQFNRCTQANRQPGSVFKPFVYLTALDLTRSKAIFTPATMIEDTAFTLETPAGPWSPQNYDKKEHGAIRLREALEKSYNIATAKLALQVGLENVVRTAKDAGITSPLNPYPAIALGVFEVTPLEIAASFGIFPNNGLYAPTLAIMDVATPQGTILAKKTLKTHRAFDPAPVALVNTLLKGVIDHGTAQAVRAQGLDFIVAGKTGTTSNYRDAWFVGFTPNLLALSWVGYDDNTPAQMTGARGALPLWIDFMKNALPNGSQDFPLPREIILVKIDPQTGKLADKRCPESTYEYFIEGTEPEEVCPLHTGRGAEPDSF